MKLHISKIKIPDSETHYRYDDYHYENGLMVKMSKFYSVKETPCFHYVVDEWEFSRIRRYDIDVLSRLNYHINVKKVGKSALRSYCYTSKQIALSSFEKRKLKQIFHAETAISKAKLALRKLSGMSAKEVGDSINCGLDDHLQTFIFD